MVQPTYYKPLIPRRDVVLATDRSTGWHRERPRSGTVSPLLADRRQCDLQAMRLFLCTFLHNRSYVSTVNATTPVPPYRS